ncbi:TPA: hypothetical protein R8G79_001528 [Citrobacter amalonaticus]|nr:hypothetical protein [Citrobacter amalonaticus]
MKHTHTDVDDAVHYPIDVYHPGALLSAVFTPVLLLLSRNLLSYYRHIHSLVVH